MTQPLFADDAVSVAAAGPSNRLVQPLHEQFDQVPGDWRELTEAFRLSPAGQALITRLEARRVAGDVIYPAQVFAALHATPRQQVRVVILGQDPYHGPDQAHGLAFSVQPGVKIPPSLRNIFKERLRDLGLPPPPTGDLSAWARQGVLLLNTSLSVQDGLAGSHARWGWEALTDALIAAVAQSPTPVVFMLWGAHAQSKRALIAGAGNTHLVLACNHPSPLSALRGPEPFIGCGHLGRAQAFLTQHGALIHW